MSLLPQLRGRGGPPERPAPALVFLPARTRSAAGELGRGNRWVVETDAPVWAAAPGQAAVLYDGDVVLGGGRICRPAA